MTQENQQLTQYISKFDQFEKSLNGQKEQSVHQLRKKAFNTLVETGFPTSRDEEWRFTNINPILENNYEQILADDKVPISKEEVEPFLYKEWSGPQLVFIDGIFSDLYSTTGKRQNGITVTHLASAMSSDQDELISTFGHYETFKENAFSALNTAFLNDGAVVKIEENAIIIEPVHLVYISSNRKKAQVSHPRNLIILGENSQATIVESFNSLDNHKYFNNVVTEISIEANAKLNHIRIQNESQNAFHIGNVFVEQKQDSNYLSTSIVFGGLIARNNIYANLNGEGIESTLNGLYMGHGDQLIDNHTFLDHVKPHCNSNEIYQGILTGSANGVFSGKIMVHPDAQKTDAKQSNNCLLLSEEADINSKPQLEIYADDVRCTHGATVGQLNEEAIFYLRSRGISNQQAKNILTYAFAEQVIEGVNIRSVRDQVDKLLLDRLKEDMNFVK